MCVSAGEVMSHWTLDPLALGIIGVSSLLYARGVRGMWKDAGRGHGARPWQVAAFAGGELALFIALISPLDRASDFLFSAHMTQHELLMIVAAPLLVVGKPLAVSLRGLPSPARAVAIRFAQSPRVLHAWRFATRPVLVLVVHGAIVWLWHLPVLFEAALRNEWIHGVQHGSFFVTAALFWWAIVHGRYGRAGYGLSVLFVFATAMHTSVLGALLGLGTRLYYPDYGPRAAAWGFDALADQEVAGFIMWVPCGTLLALIALGLFAAWLGEAQRRHRAARLAKLASVAALALVLGGCHDKDGAARTLTGGEPARGRTAIRKYGCGSCHTIPGVPGANALVGPPLEHMAKRSYVAGVLPNSPSSLESWIMHPQSHKPTAMPEMGVTEPDARDITAYLYTLD